MIEKGTKKEHQTGSLTQDRQEWFERWFSSPMYESLYAGRDATEAKQMIDLIEQRVPPAEDQRVLDLACGRGRHSLALARRGYHVTGMDLSQRAIQTASLKAQKEGLEVDFIVGDMRVPLQKRFDLIVNLFTSFGYFDREEDDIRVLEAIGKMNRKGGWVVIDFLNPDWVRSSLVESEERELGGSSVKISRWIKEGRVHKRMEFEDGGLNGAAGSATPAGTAVFQERVTLYPKEWFTVQMDLSGYELVDLFGEYDGTPYSSDSSRMIFFFRKVD